MYVNKPNIVSWTSTFLIHLENFLEDTGHWLNSSWNDQPPVQSRCPWGLGYKRGRIRKSTHKCRNSKSFSPDLFLSRDGNYSPADRGHSAVWQKRAQPAFCLVYFTSLKTCQILSWTILAIFFHFNGYIYSLKIYFLYNIRFVFFMVFLSKCAMIWCKQICSLCAITRNVAQNFQTELGPSPTLDLAVVTMRLLLMGCFCFWELNQVKWSQNFSVTYGANYAQGNKGALGSQKCVREPRLPDECQLQHKCRSIRLILKGWDW